MRRLPSQPVFDMGLSLLSEKSEYPTQQMQGKNLISNVK